MPRQERNIRTRGLVMLLAVVTMFFNISCSNELGIRLSTLDNSSQFGVPAIYSSEFADEETRDTDPEILGVSCNRNRRWLRNTKRRRARTCIPPTRNALLDLDADTDRTGKIDGNYCEEAAEEKYSLIVLNNCDDDNHDSVPDHGDSRVNGSDDLHDTEPVILRRLEIPLTSKIALHVKSLSKDEVDAEEHVRVFDDSGVEIIGPDSGPKYVLDREAVRRLNSGDMKFAVEGLSFGSSVRMCVTVDSTIHDSFRIDVAPFLLTPHHLKAYSDMVCRLPDLPASDKYVDAFSKHCRTAGVSVRDIRDNEGDPWIEDEISWGVTSTPRTTMPVALHMLRQGWLSQHVENLLAANVGYFKAFDYGDAVDSSSLDFGGNLEVTPPTPAFPFGRVYYGSIRSEGVEYFQRSIDPGFQAFFKRQELQPPIDLNSDWLGVGHVDEVISFLPKKDSDSFILLLASPKMALDILRQMGTSSTLDAHYQDYGVSTVEDMMNLRFLMRSFEDYNMDVDEKIFGDDHSTPSPKSIKGILMKALDLKEDQVREVPVLFENFHSSNSWDSTAITPGIVNLSSVGEYCIVPDPFIPEFRQAFTNAVRDAGQTPLWIDDWEIYHRGSGEVHCGSNEKRKNFSNKWWK